MAPCLPAFAQRHSEVGASLRSSYRDRARSSWDDLVAQHAYWLWVEHGCVSELSRKPRHWRGPGCLSKIAAVGEYTARDFERPYRPVMCGFWFRRRARLHRAMVLKMSPPAPDPPTERSIKVAAYVVGGIVASATIAVVVVIPEAVRFHAKGPPNTGHDALACSDCHKDAPGTMRQQLQAKVQFWLGFRATDAVFGHTPVGNEQCTACHARDQDSHPVHRFLEPRFFEARAELGAESCVSCHRGHETFEKPPEVDERWPRDGYYQRRWKPSCVSSSAEHLPNTVIRVSEANQIDRELI